MNKGLLIGAMSMLAFTASPVFAEQHGSSSGSVDKGSSYSRGDATTIAASALIAGGLIGGGVLLSSDKGHGGTTTSTATSTSTSTATSTGN